MADEPRPGLLDQAVELLARAMNALGLNGTRLLWKWNRRRRELGESGMRSQILWRSARVRHKMCRSCRALVPRGARRCPECAAPLGEVSVPGIGRVLGQVLPGATTASSLLLLVNGFWFLLMLMTEMRSGASSESGLGLLGFFDSRLTTDFGSGDALLTWSGEWWRIITPVFLHRGILHFFFNSWVLLQIGPLAESEFRTARFWVAYLACGVAGSATSQILQPLLLHRGVDTIGASGAILGVIGLLLVHGWRTGGVRGQGLKSMMGRYVLYVLVMSLLVPHLVDHFNHAGGFVCGALFGALLPAGPYRSTAAQRIWQALAVVGVLVVLVAFAQVAAHLD